MVNWSKVLENFTLEELLESVDVTPEEVLEMLVDQGYEFKMLPCGVNDD